VPVRLLCMGGCTRIVHEALCRTSNSYILREDGFAAQAAAGFQKRGMPHIQQSHATQDAGRRISRAGLKLHAAQGAYSGGGISSA